MRFILILIIISSSSLLSQGLRQPFKYSRNWSVAAGLRTQMVLGEPNGGKLIVRDTNNPRILNGGFENMQPGIELQYTYYWNDDKFRIPIAFGYNFYSTAELRYVTPSRQLKLKHKVDFIDFRTGFHYSFVRFPLANARAYAGIEIAGNLIRPRLFDNRIVDILDPDFVQINETPLKDNAFRLGSIIRLGAEGELEKNLMINMSAGISFVNVLFRDDERRELMTPITTFETGESFMMNFSLSFLIQYGL